MGVSVSEAARRVGITAQSMAARIRRGTVPVLSDGTIAEKVVRELVADHDPTKSEQNPNKGRGRKTTTTPTADAPQPDTDVSPIRRKQLVDAERAEAEWRKQRGELVDGPTLEKALAAIGVRARQSGQAMPHKLQDALARRLKCKTCGGAVDARHTAIVVEQVVHEWLADLARELEAAR